jgi:DNA polymerase eta
MPECFVFDQARAAGVKRGMRGEQAVQKCPEIVLVTVPTAHGKADLTIYRAAGAAIVACLEKECPRFFSDF